MEERPWSYQNGNINGNINNIDLMEDSGRARLGRDRITMDHFYNYRIGRIYTGTANFITIERVRPRDESIYPPEYQLEYVQET